MLRTISIHPGAAKNNENFEKLKSSRSRGHLFVCLFADTEKDCDAISILEPSAPPSAHGNGSAASPSV